MNELEFEKLWIFEKPIYEAWGNCVSKKISTELRNKKVNLKTFFKIPLKVRLKDNKSLIDKAFYRSEKKYSDPYTQIEDKVGIRIVVLLIEDIHKICNIIDVIDEWKLDICKHFDKDKKQNPLLFTYQSVHYIIRPKTDIKIENLVIPKSTPCELQIRTLLQHAHAELTHNSIYKTTKKIQPNIHRTVAKSMALIETTDDFFTEVTQELNNEPTEKLLKKLDEMYYELIKKKPQNQKFSIVILHEFEKIINTDQKLSKSIEQIQDFIIDNPNIKIIILDSYNKNTLYRQSTIIFVYWLLKEKRNRLLRDWPLDKNILEPLATDLGVSIHDES